MFLRLKNSLITIAKKVSDKYRKISDWLDTTVPVRFIKYVIGKPLALDESYTYKLLTFFYGSVTCVRPNRRQARFFYRAALALLFALTITLPFLPGGALFSLVVVIFALYLALLFTSEEIKTELSDFDILLLLFCLTTLTVASVGKPILGMVSAWLVFGSFIMLYVFVINLVRRRTILFYLKLCFCIAGALIGAAQLIGNIFSFELRVLGQIYVLCTPVAIEMFFYAKDKRLKALLVLMAAVMFLALTVVWSGGGWAWVTFVLAFFIVIRDWRLITIGGVCLLFIPMITPFKIIDFQTLTHEGVFQYILGPSSDYRMSAFEAIRGFFSYYRDNSMMGHWYASIIVVVCVAVLLILLIKEIFSHLKVGKTGMICAILAAVGSGVTGFLYQDISTGIFNNYRALLIFWLFISIYASQARIEEESEGKTYPPVKKIAGRLSFIDIIPALLTVAIVLAALNF